MLSRYIVPMTYTYIDTDEKIIEAVPHFEEKERIAVDFEGEFNLHVYGEHLCLIQVFDGESFFIIDPRAAGVTPKGLEVFFSSSVRKLWFDCQSDASLVYKAYGLRINNIFDIRVVAEALGFHGNLKSLEETYLGIRNDLNKKKNQQANWLKRPIPEEQIEYALEDVAHLPELEDVLSPIAEEKNLEKQIAAAMKKATAAKKSLPGWTRIGGWKLLSKEEKVYARQIFIARDRIARRFNVPASRVMDKHQISALAKARPSSEAKLASILQNESERFRSILIPAVWNAILSSAEELRSERQNG